MKYLAILSVLALACADRPLDYWYRLCSKDTAKNGAIKAECDFEKTKKQNACLLKSEVYQRSIFACFEECESRSNHTNKDAFTSSWKYAEFKLKGDFSLSIPELIELEKSDPVTQSYADANTTQSGAFLPRAKFLSDTNIDAQSEWTIQKVLANRWGQITCYYIFGVVVAQTIFNFLSWLLPGLVRVVCNNVIARYIRRYIAIPAILYKRGGPTPIFRPRYQFMIMLGYLVLCVVGLAFHYPILLSPVVSKTKKDLISGYLGQRAGAMLVYKLPILFLFAGRNNFMIWMTGWQMEVFNYWHRWIARLAIIDMLIHAISYCIDDAGPDFVEKRASVGWWRVGVTAGVAMILMAIQGIRWIRSKNYEAFLVFHILMAILVVVGAYYHVRDRSMGIIEIYTVIAVWGFDRLCRFLRIMSGGLNNKATLRVLPGDLLEINVRYTGWWTPAPGAYVFVHFADKFGFWQSHPLSVIPVSKNEIKFVAKAQRGMTRTMYDRCVAAGGQTQVRVWLDGPYGIHFPTKQYKEVVTLAGGIGFTSVYSHTIEMLKRNPAQNVHMHWAVSNSDPVAAFSAELATLQTYKNLKITVHMSKITTTAYSVDEKEKSVDETASETSSLDIVPVEFAPDFNSLIGDHIKNAQGPICLFSCGPPAMAHIVRESVSKNLLSSKQYVQFYEEFFTI